jgi:hypothetical protein
MPHELDTLATSPLTRDLSYSELNRVDQISTITPTMILLQRKLENHRGIF